MYIILNLSQLQKMTPDNSNERERWLQLVQRHVASLKFGVVQITVHESRVVQIERSEKFRIADARLKRSQTQTGEEELSQHVMYECE